MNPLPIGSRLRWTSQAGGYSKTKEGEIFAVVPAGEDGFEPVWEVEPTAARSRIRFDRYSYNKARYVVRVPGPRLPRYYAPHVTRSFEVIERA